jgi:uncharacterized membrane protein
MKTPIIAGLALVLAGVILLVYRGFRYKTEEEVLKIGPIKATAQETHHVPIPAIVGWTVTGVGIVLLVVGLRRGTG